MFDTLARATTLSGGSPRLVPMNAIASYNRCSERIVGHSAKGPISSRCRLDSDLVIYGCGDTLRAAEVALSRLDRHMAEEKLNLLQFTSGRPT